MITLVNKMTVQVTAIDARFVGDILHVSLNDGREISVPVDRIKWLDWLAKATPQQRVKWSLEPGGYALYWEELDDGIEISHLLNMQPLA